MNYYRLAIISFFFSLILICLVFYYSNLTRQSEQQIELTRSEIFEIKEKIKINELELAVHTSPAYLKKLDIVYSEDALDENVNLNIFNIQKLDSKSIEQVFSAKFN